MDPNFRVYWVTLSDWLEVVRDYSNGFLRKGFVTRGVLYYYTFNEWRLWSVVEEILVSQRWKNIIRRLTDYGTPKTHTCCSIGVHGVLRPVVTLSFITDNRPKTCVTHAHIHTYIHIQHTHVYTDTNADLTKANPYQWAQLDGNVMAHGDAREGKWRENWQMEWIASTLHTTSEQGVSNITTADVHTSSASSRLNWRPPPRQFKSIRPFRRKTKSGFCACAITFQTQSTACHNLFF
jgi:hypothetical protein